MIYKKGKYYMDTIKYIFSSLFSNKKIIDESKTRPWYLAIIIGLLSQTVTSLYIQCLFSDYFQPFPD